MFILSFLWRCCLEMLSVGPSGLSRYLPHRPNLGDAIFFDEERLGVDGEPHLAVLTRVLPLRDLQSPLDALGLHRCPETGGAAFNFYRDLHHLRSSFVLLRNVAWS